MKILCVDPQGFALDWCIRAQADGHDIKWYVRDTPRCKYIGRGLIARIEDWHMHIKWADMIFITDNVGLLKEMDDLRRRGTPVFGPTHETADWELSRTKGMDIFRRHGIKVADYREFSDYDRAIEYVKKTMTPYVSKPCGDEADKSLSYVAKHPADLIYMLQRWKKAKRHKGPFILQEKIDGVEMAVGGWCGPHGFNDGWHENWEFKRLMTGDMGPNTGEMGTVLRVVRNSKLADMVLAPIEEELVDAGYVGYVDVNCIVDASGNPWPLEFTMRPGWPTFNIQQALQKGDHAEWMMALCEGRDARNFRMNEVAVGVVMAIPDFPYSTITRKDVVGVPLYGVTTEILPWLHPCEMMYDMVPKEIGGVIVETPAWVSAGDYILVATGCDPTVSGARDKCYEVLKSITMPNSPMWRTDIGEKLKQQIPKLQKKGFAMGMAY